MAMIFQSYALWPHMTVTQNVAYGLRFKSGVSKGDRDRRVAVARALVVEPEILLLDEPLSNLDANLREEMRFEIRRLHESFGITTLYVTHDQAEAMVISDRVAVLHRGRVVQVGTAEDLFRRPSSYGILARLPPVCASMASTLRTQGRCFMTSRPSLSPMKARMRRIGSSRSAWTRSAAFSWSSTRGAWIPHD